MAGVGNLGKISWVDVYKSNAFGENLVESRKVIGLAVGKGQKKKKIKLICTYSYKQNCQQVPGS